MNILRRLKSLNAAFQIQILAHETDINLDKLPQT
jgi:hypothetical protein